jgi:hypothetical protein
MKVLGRNLRQADLFDAKPKTASEQQVFRLAEICARANVTESDLRTWRSVGFLTFDPFSTWPLEHSMYRELVFIRDLARVEFSINAIRKLLSSLSNTRAVSHHEICYDFQSQLWRRHFNAVDVLSSSVDGQHRLESCVIGMIQSLGRFGCVEELQRIQAVTSETLNALNESD